MLRLFQRRNEIGERPVVDPPTALRGGDRETDGEVGFPDARWPEENDILASLDEAERVQAIDLLALDRRLKGEIEFGKRLGCRESRRAHRRLESAVVAQRDLGTEQCLDRRGRLHGPTINPAQNVVERFERAGHLEIGQLRAQAIRGATARWLWAPSSHLLDTTFDRAVRRERPPLDGDVGHTSHRAMERRSLLTPCGEHEGAIRMRRQRLQRRALVALEAIARRLLRRPVDPHIGRRVEPLETLHVQVPVAQELAPVDELSRT